METILGKLDRTEKALAVYGHFILNYNQRCRLEPHKRITKPFESICTDKTKLLKRNKSQYDYLPVRKKNILDKVVSILEEANLNDIPGYVYSLFQRYELPFLNMLLVADHVEYYFKNKDQEIDKLDKLFKNDCIIFLTHLKYHENIDVDLLNNCYKEVTPLFLRYISEAFDFQVNDKIVKKSISQYLLWPYGFHKSQNWNKIVTTFFGDDYASHYIRFD